VSSQAVTLIVFVCVFGGALLGIVLRTTLPEEHLSAASRDVVKLAMGTIATMSAVIMGLLVASAKGYYDTQNAELTQMSARIVLLDRILAHYGPEECWIGSGKEALQRWPRCRRRGPAKVFMTKFRRSRHRMTRNDSAGPRL
jgi:hypothetical protein